MVREVWVPSQVAKCSMRKIRLMKAPKGHTLATARCLTQRLRWYRSLLMTRTIAVSLPRAAFPCQMETKAIEFQVCLNVWWHITAESRLWPNTCHIIHRTLRRLKMKNSEECHKSKYCWTQYKVLGLFNQIHFRRCLEATLTSHVLRGSMKLKTTLSAKT